MAIWTTNNEQEMAKQKEKQNLFHFHATEPIRLTRNECRFRFSLVQINDCLYVHKYGRHLFGAFRQLSHVCRSSDWRPMCECLRTGYLLLHITRHNSLRALTHRGICLYLARIHTQRETYCRTFLSSAACDERAPIDPKTYKGVN